MNNFKKSAAGLMAASMLLSSVFCTDVMAAESNPRNSEFPVLKSTMVLGLGLYYKLNLNDLGLSEKAYQYAIDGYNKLVRQGKILKQNVLTIIDFTKSSAQKRLFIIDLNSGKLLFHTWVAHGRNSGEAFARTFSNEISSLQSSLGFYVTGSTYEGKNGYSMILQGLEKDINDHAEERSIVMHGAEYVSASLASEQGYIGRSWGCPAVPENLTEPIIQTIKGGSCLFIYGKDKSYLKKSRIL